MAGIRSNVMLRRIVDACMTITLLFLMAYQSTGVVLHEWIGMAMTLLVIIHQVLNRKWYGAVFKGKYHPYRILTTVVNTLLILSFVLTALSGMSMSGHAVPFLYGMIKIYYSKMLHISMSQWAFVLMGVHLGIHIPMMTAKLKLCDRRKKVLSAISCFTAGVGLNFFIRNGMFEYMFLRSVFASFDYSKSGAFVLLENVVMLLFWAFIGAQLSNLCSNSAGKSKRKNVLQPLIYTVAAIIIGLMLQIV